MTASLRMRCSLIFALLLVFGLARCDGNAADGIPASVRVIHAASGTNAIDFLIDFDLLARNLAFRQSSPYVQWEPGLRRLEARSTQNTQEAAARDALLDEEQAYSILVTGLADASSLIVLEDDRSDPPSGQAQVRVVNAQSSSLTVQATDEAGSPVFNTNVLRFGETSASTIVSPGSLTVLASPSSGGSLPALVQSIEAGRRYLIVVTPSLLFAVVDG